MDRQEKIKLAITSGIGAVILLILVLVIALSGKKGSDDEKLEENIASYSDSSEATSDSTTIAEPATAEVSTEESIEDKAGTAASSTDEAASQSSIRAGVAVNETIVGTVSGNSFYGTHTAAMHRVYSSVQFNVQSQLYEMYEYWFQGNMDAVRDLAHLERFEAMSYSLRGTRDFYYYGETDSEGIPNGEGLAVYANCQYYYGSWVAGKREGKGSWFSFYPAYNDYVVTEHLYTGDWANDLPDGQGQEHYDYDLSKMNVEDIYLQNAIGGFSQGKYNGDMYIITVDRDGNAKEWSGVCDNGNWEEVPYASVDQLGRIPVLTDLNDGENHIYMTPAGSKDNKASGIISGGDLIES